MNEFVLNGNSSNVPDFENHAARAFAVMWNSLDLSVIEPLLASDIRYESQMVFEPLLGRHDVIKHLRGKMRSVQRELPAGEPFAELGVVLGRPCVVLAQGTKENRIGVVLFSVKDEKIRGVDICTIFPMATEVPETGIYPNSLDDPHRN